ncbi:glycine zipper domain-containing protein [Segnochrobactrum spirostomi]|uniref:Bacteriocin n=1 Tax=Segnochrobactrum spirostomi TaxID=2608987 RepID=A0A6A7Y4G1_9HYPH|nr:glycine zipper domain-containing protein [Segnochrobactrum spirostomi]MQT14033.1 bacteriocin [Segnochrobactrum spirostomi]
MRKLILVAALSLMAAACTSEQSNRAVTGGAIGAAAGAATGALVTRNAGGALTGAAIGGVGGAAIGAATAPKTCTAYDAYGRAYQTTC